MATVLVTGANRGIGSEVCRQLAALGHRVVVTSRGESGLALAKELPNDAAWLPLDVTDAGSVKALAGEVERLGKLDALVNNAAVALDGFDAEMAKATLEANYLGPRRVTDALLPHLADGAKVVMVSSGSGELSRFGHELRPRFLDPKLDREKLDALVAEFVRRVGDESYSRTGWPRSAYGVSKAALNALTRLYARELGPTGPRVNAVCPGWVCTDMGGENAPRTVEEGAKGIVWAALLTAEGPTGQFFRDGRAIGW
jgi:carbonyl reductase 1